MTAPAISGVLETGVYVEDLSRARAFYEGVLGLKPMLADERFCAYDAGPGSVLLLFKRGATLTPVRMAEGVIPAHDGHGPLHYALAIPAPMLELWVQHLEAQGVEIESRVDWKGVVVILYFRDPVQNLVELATPGRWDNY